MTCRKRVTDERVRSKRVRMKNKKVIEIEGGTHQRGKRNLNCGKKEEKERGETTGQGGGWWKKKKYEQAGLRERGKT